jgi:hypothetical protein
LLFSTEHPAAGPLNSGVRPFMNHLVTLIALLASTCAAGASPPRQPLASGEYAFQHKYAEQPNMPSVALTAKIKGRHVVLINNEQSAVFPKGVIAEGTIMWHARSKQWIIGHSKRDQYAEAVGGCSDGPEVIDFQNKVYWTC